MRYIILILALVLSTKILAFEPMSGAQTLENPAPEMGLSDELKDDLYQHIYKRSNKVDSGVLKRRHQELSRQMKRPSLNLQTRQRLAIELDVIETIIAERSAQVAYWSTLAPNLGIDFIKALAVAGAFDNHDIGIVLPQNIQR